jgi:gliding motility-associated-like protein
LKATTNLGCVDSLRKPDLIRINKTPTTNFIIGPSEISFIDEPDFQFDNMSQDADDYYWNLGDLTLTQEDSPEHRYDSAGNFCVKLVSVANYTVGIPTCVDSLEKCLEILPLSVCFVPNSFSPNDDDINDVFAAKASRITEFEMVIHNRWGEQVYRSFDINNGWDGRYGNTVAPMGTYLYTVLYRDNNYRPYLLKGNLVLLR